MKTRGSRSALKKDTNVYIDNEVTEGKGESWKVIDTCVMEHTIGV